MQVDPAEHFLAWTKPAVSVLVIKKIYDKHATECFKELTRWLIMVRYVHNFHVYTLRLIHWPNSSAAAETNAGWTLSKVLWKKFCFESLSRHAFALIASWYRVNPFHQRIMRLKASTNVLMPVSSTYLLLVVLWALTNFLHPLPLNILCVLVPINVWVN